MRGFSFSKRVDGWFSFGLLGGLPENVREWQVGHRKFVPQELCPLWFMSCEGAL